MSSGPCYGERGTPGNRAPIYADTVGERVACALWWVSADLLLALDARLGPPVDSYLNGSQTWLTDDGPGGVTLEWRLHPVAGFVQPGGLSHYDLWESVVGQLSAGAAPDALEAGEERRALAELWDGLECFAAYGDELEPAPLTRAVNDALGLAPDRSGLVDHDAVGDAWEHAHGSISIVALLAEHLAR